MMLKHSFSIIICSLVVILPQYHIIAEFRCRCLTNDSNCWPNEFLWQHFNRSIDGRLVSVRPSFAVCNDNPVDTDACNYVMLQWTNGTWRSEQIGAMQIPYWENSSCSENVSCTQGSVSRLAVNATTSEHVQATIRFASKHNLRLVIKSTGHDFLGRSTAADSLLLWLHYMKRMELIEKYMSCTGNFISNAIRIDAGVQWGEVYRWLSAYNLVAIGGASESVGAIGGYLQGGGHGLLTRWKGMAADQVLEFDVVTADGKRQTVNECHNKDLFWALRGGGAGTFAVALSAVLRAYPSPSMISALYTISTQNEVRYKRFIRDFIQLIPALADDGWAGYFSMLNTTISIGFFAPNQNFTVATTLFERFMNNNADMKFIMNDIASFPSFYAYYSKIMTGTNPTGGNVLLGSRLISEVTVRNQAEQVAEVFFRIRGRSQHNTILAGHLVAGGNVSNPLVENSVNPAWRHSLLHMIYAQTWLVNATMIEKEQMSLNLRTQMDVLETIAGGIQSASYLNEADPNEPNWQQKYFGTQQIYNRLKTIKKQVDPDHLFICRNCVGSDDWKIDLNCPK